MAGREGYRKGAVARLLAGDEPEPAVKGDEEWGVATHEGKARFLSSLNGTQTYRCV